MFGIREVVDPQERRRLWNALQPQECLFDLWPVRECFARRFGAEPQAQLQVVAERLRALDRVDRRVVMSGQAGLRLQQHLMP